jgi:hypothetical protein
VHVLRGRQILPVCKVVRKRTEDWSKFAHLRLSRPILARPTFNSPWDDLRRPEGGGGQGAGGEPSPSEVLPR